MGREGRLSTVDEIWAELFVHNIDAGLAAEICHLMAKKPLRVQRAFLLRCRGDGYEAIAGSLKVSLGTAWYLLHRDCADVHAMLCGECAMD